MKQRPLEELFTGGGIGGFAEFHIEPDELNDLIEIHGTGCTLRRAVRCPCMRVETRQPRSGCPACAGTGVAHPVDMEEPIVALILSRSMKRTMAAPGEMITGSVAATFPLGIVPGEGDMLLPDTDVHNVQQVLTRAALQVDLRDVHARATVPEQLAPRLHVAPDLLLYPDPVAIEYVAWLSADGNLRSAQQGRDYTRQGRRMEWREGHGPGPGESYTVRYRAKAAYMLHAAEPMVRAEGENVYPYRADAQRLDRWGGPEFRR